MPNQNITSLDKCGLVQTQNCIKKLCPLYSEEGNCILDVSGSMFQNMAQKLTLAGNMWNSTDRNQKIKAGIDLLKKLSS
jgi:hypothetical protein